MRYLCCNIPSSVPTASVRSDTSISTFFLCFRRSFVAFSSRFRSVSRSMFSVHTSRELLFPVFSAGSRGNFMLAERARGVSFWVLAVLLLSPAGIAIKSVISKVTAVKSLLLTILFQTGAYWMMQSLVSFYKHSVSCPFL